MKDKVEICPLCGSEIVQAYNNSTKQTFYKCSNTSCHFRLGEFYTEKEVSLQGIELNTECKGCGSPLTVACGPKGLYATCLRCTYDLRPNMLGGFVYKKHANAHNVEAEKEIEELISNYVGTIDEDYSFDDFLEPKEEAIKEPIQNEVISEITSEIFKNINREEFIKYYNKGYSINQLSQQLGVSKSEVRGAKRVLLKEGVISTYVNKKHPKATITELKDTQEFKTPREGSSLEKVVNFFKENINKKLNAQVIHEETGVGYSTVCNYLTQLRKTKVIKMVGYEGNTNPYVILYADKESPIPELEVVKENEKYVTSAKFFKKHTKELAKIDIQTPTFLNRLIEERNPKEYMMLTSQGLRKTYLESELLELFNPVKKESTLSTKTKKRCSKEKYFVKIGDVVLNFLKKNINKKYSIQDVAKATKINENSVSSALKVMRNHGKVKIVGNDETRMLFQVTESPIPELDLKSNKEYISLFNFYQNNKSIVSSLSKVETEVANAGLHPYKIITRRGIGYGYSIKELEKLFLNKTKSKEIIENIDIPIEQLKTVPIVHKSNVLGFVTSMFKKKDTSDNFEELISF